MKRLFLPLLITVAATVPAHAKPTDPKKPPARARAPFAMPAEVRASLPSGAKSLYLGKQPMGTGGKNLLVHLWAAGRKTSPYYQHEFEPSPFCVDLFALAGKDEYEPGKWHRVSSTVYLGEDGPRDPKDVSVRWLYPTKKLSPILTIVSPSYLSTRYMVITYAHGVGEGENSPSYVQDFYQGGLGGGKTVYDFGVDARGVTAVLEKSWYQSGPISTTTRSWNGREYARMTDAQK